MPFSCTFFFHGPLNDFLPRKRKEQWIPYSAKTPASAKDAIEALGVPHVEVMRIEINGKEKAIGHLLQPNDTIHVFPYANQFPRAAPKTFILDVHLGKLARLLRLLGIDAFYHNNLSDGEIVRLAAEQKRSVLTRDVGLLKHKVLHFGYWLRSQQPEQQLLEVVQWFSLCPFFLPFSRCMCCNGLLQPVKKSTIAGILPSQTKTCFDDFFQCTDCGKIYWKGSHYERLQQWVNRIRSVAC